MKKIAFAVLAIVAAAFVPLATPSSAPIAKAGGIKPPQ